MNEGTEMAAYEFDELKRSILEGSVVPMGIYQVVDGRVTTLLVSDGFCELFGCRDRQETLELMNRDPYWNVHPDDLQRVIDESAAFMGNDTPYNLVCRIKSENGYRLIHLRGKRVITETGARLAVVWYIDEGSVNVDATRAQGDDRIVGLKASLQSLLNNMPAMTFSKDVATSRYLACNQMFADFVGKGAPEEVVGQTDYDFFDKATADRLVSDNRATLSMDEPYRLFEEVQDSAGDLHRLETVKLKFVDEMGRLCVLGMSLDVTETLRAKEENERARAAYEEAVSVGAVYESIVHALSDDYFNLYYVDMETDDYVEYGSRTERGQNAEERRGVDFFAESRRNAPHFIYRKDLQRFREELDKEKLSAEVKRHGAYTYHYRLMIDGVPTYVSMKATRVPGDDGHIVIGVSNVNTQVRDRMAAERAVEARKAYLRLKAFAGNLIVLYYVDPESGEYTEFSTTASYESLGIAKRGSDFFETTYENSLDTVHPEDQELFHSHVTKENVLAAIEQNGSFALDYRLMSDGLPTYVRLKAVMVEEDGKGLLVIGLLDEDAQVRQEHEYERNLTAAREKAVIDPLTGVKNKHAYAEWEGRINTAMAKGEQEPFAVVICDVNDLKTVNDQYGHKEGDACIKRACARICDAFAHSPVFRVGGDEFAVILTAGDYERRSELMELVTAVPRSRSEQKVGETIAAGMAKYEKGRHSSLLSVFEEADQAMYKRKRAMKEANKSVGSTDEARTDLGPIPIMNARKTILVAEDVELQRDIMDEYLGDDYDIIFASDGVEAMEKLRSHKHEISLVLLDLYMPRMTGREVISEMQIDDDLMSIPVVFLTVDQDAELDCLRIGAMDFIPKPFPDIEIVKARIAKCIELSEDRDLIRQTERDRLTGLLNKEYFFRYVERLDQIHEDEVLDALACDINNLHAINERYGRQFGDHVLHCVGAGIRRLARQTEGIGCREGGDTFLLYCPHQQDYERLLGAFVADLFDDRTMASRVSLRFGVLTDAQGEPDVEERFVRAKAASDGVKGDPHRVVGFYEYDSQDV